MDQNVTEELVDLVDDSGRAILRRVPRSEVKRRRLELLDQGLYQPIVIVVVLDMAGHVVAQVRGKAKGDDGAEEIDHVCGVVSAGESWESAARREAAEEIGVELDRLALIEQRVNVYQRYRSLAVAIAVGTPEVVNPFEVSSIVRAYPHELRDLVGRRAFVKGFFSDMDLALAHANRADRALFC
ncbi:NUDIX hydrolase [Kribbella soli]